ncbi:MAG: replicative DNA helicase [Planctomycetota bacterium]|nr:replicative DNA helicase [Planctomycetota bacterium]
MAKTKINGRSTSNNPVELSNRTPPCSLDAENSVLGSILLRPSEIDEIASFLRHSDFHDDALGLLFRHLLDIHNAAGKIDLTLIAERLKTAGDFDRIGGAAALAKITRSVASASHAVHYARIVRAKSLRRSIIDVGAEMTQAGFDESIADDELLSIAESRIFAIAEQRAEADHTHSAIDFMRGTMERVEARKEGKSSRGLPTGFDAVDDMTGGLLPGEVTILAGRTSMGKSAFACNTAEQAAITRKVPTLLISLEMSVAEIGDRLIASQARVDLHRIKRGTYCTNEHPELIEAAGRIADSPLFIDDCPTRNMTSIAALARRHKRKHSIGFLVIDYLQLIDPDNAKDLRQEQVAKIARRLKVLAREIQVPILCLAQLNRQTELTKDNVPKLSHLRESGAIEQDADVVLFVHRPGYYSRETTPAGEGESAEIIVAKQRNGPVGTAKLLWFGSYVRFDNAEPEWKRNQNYTSEFDESNKR